MVEDGAETVYVTAVREPAANAGVSVDQRDPRRARSTRGTSARRTRTPCRATPARPIDVNALTYDYLVSVGAAGVSFPRQQTFYVSVDSATDRFSGRSEPGHYMLRSWVNDVTPPTVKLLTTRVAGGRPTIVLQTFDSQSGVDPLSLTIGYHGVLIGATSYDPVTGIAVFPLPASVPPLKAGTARLRMVSSDFQEAKNVDTVGTVDHAEHAHGHHERCTSSPARRSTGSSPPPARASRRASGWSSPPARPAASRRCASASTGSRRRTSSRARPVSGARR